MSEYNFTVKSGASLRFKTAGKYCDRDIVVTATGGAAESVIEALSATENGTYTAPDGVDGYSPVIVNVSNGGGAIDAFLDGSITEIESNLTKIGQWALPHRRNLKKVILPNVTSIEEYAFYYSFAPLEKPSLFFPSLTSVGDYAFTSSGIYTILLPKLKEVSSFMFNYSTVLTMVDLGAATRINGAAFSNCSDLTTLIIRTNSVCALAYSTVFNSTPINKKTGYIYVPSALVESYKAATNWSTFASQFRAIEDYPEITGG